jgi:hypothetical protein
MKYLQQGRGAVDDSSRGGRISTEQSCRVQSAGIAKQTTDPSAHMWQYKHHMRPQYAKKTHPAALGFVTLPPSPPVVPAADEDAAGLSIIKHNLVDRVKTQEHYHTALLDLRAAAAAAAAAVAAAAHFQLSKPFTG